MPAIMVVTVMPFARTREHGLIKVAGNHVLLWVTTENGRSDISLE